MEKNTSINRDQVQPGAVGRREMHVEARVAGEPGADGGVLVGGVVVADHMQLAAWVGAGNLLEEPQKFLVAVARRALVDDPASRDLQRSEQGGGAMSGVVVCALLRASRPHAAHGLGALEGLELLGRGRDALPPFGRRFSRPR